MTKEAIQYRFATRWLYYPLRITRSEEGDTNIRREEKIEFDAEEVEEMRKDDIRQCTRDLLLVERAREWLLEDGEVGDGA